MIGNCDLRDRKEPDSGASVDTKLLHATCNCKARNGQTRGEIVSNTDEND